jgi:hypothetical protein
LAADELGGYVRPLAHSSAPHRHDPERVAAAVRDGFGIPNRRTPSDVPPPTIARQTFDEHVRWATARLTSRSRP